MESKEVTINTTFKIMDYDVVHAERILEDATTLVDFRIVPDTKELYEVDKTFQRLVKKEKEARNSKLEYLNSLGIEY